jgi:hypothetical protein
MPMFLSGSCDITPKVRTNSQVVCLQLWRGGGGEENAMHQPFLPDFCKKPNWKNKIYQTFEFLKKFIYPGYCRAINKNAL